MAQENVSNYQGATGSVPVIGGSSVKKLLVYNNSGSDIANGSIVKISYQHDGTSGNFPVIATPGASDSFNVEVAVVNHLDENAGSPYSGIKNGSFGYVQTYGYCEAIKIPSSGVVKDDYFAATPSQQYMTDQSTTYDAKAMGVIMTTVTNTQYTAGTTTVDGFLFGFRVTY